MRFDKSHAGDKQHRRVRRKHEDVKGLSITSLLDVLTIILVFLIKNVSMEAVKVSELPDMQYPNTITVEELIDKAEVTAVKMYLDRILIGNENLYFATPQELKADESKRSSIETYLGMEYTAIVADETKEPCLIVQADSNLPCDYITEIVRLGTYIGYTNIYFATLEAPDWLKAYNPGTIQ